MSKIKHLFTVICRDTVIDPETNNLSINQIYEELQFNEIHDSQGHSKKDNEPAILSFPFEITSMFYRDDAAGKGAVVANIEFIDPKQKKLGDFELEFAFKENTNRARTRIKLDSIAVTTSGKYLFKIYLKEDVNEKSKGILVEEVPLKITLT